MKNQRPNSIVIKGTGKYVPEKIVTNDDLAKIVDTSDEWIYGRSGIKCRRIAAEGHTLALLLDADEKASGDALVEQLTLANERLRLLTGVQFPMTLTDSGNGHKVTVDADETFDNGVLWQQDAENFVCMEPWNGWANSVNEEGRHEVLEPDEAMTSEWSITIEKV